MGKTVNRKKNIKRRRTIRRTVGALLMVTAITVAAIPIPETQAYDPNDTASQVQSYASLGISAEAAEDNLTMARAQSLGNINSFTNTGRTYYLDESTGIQVLDWQFEYKSEGNSNSDVILNNAFITGYNNSEATPRPLDLSSGWLFSDYVTIELDAFNNLNDDSVSFGSCTSYPTTEYASDDKYIVVPVKFGSESPVNVKIEKLGIKYTLDGDPALWSSSNEVYNFFSTFFPDDLNDYVTKYNAYKEAISKGEPAVVPNTVTRKKSESSIYRGDTGYRYVCRQIVGDDETDYVNWVLSNKTGEDPSYGLYLKDIGRCNYATDGSRLPSDKVYVVKSDKVDVRTAFTPSKSYGKGFFTDGQGVVVRQAIRVRGIGQDASGKGAFENVVNVNKLTLGQSINFICDRAFKDTNVLNEVVFGGNTMVGNQAFYNCQDLQTIDLTGVRSIGKEAFVLTSVNSLTIPNTLVTIEDGAFYDCGYLQSVEFQEGQNATTIGKAAFCDAKDLSSVSFGDNRNITQIGDYAFAKTKDLAITDKVVEFKFPDYITDGDKLGQFALANRKALQRVILSAGLSTKGTYNPADNTGTPDIPDTLVAGCINLSSFEFPIGVGADSHDNLKGVSYDPTMFYDVVNSEFYVLGPEGDPYSVPRQCTWRASMDVARNSPDGIPVTYKYYRDDDINNPATYEVSNGFLIQGIDVNGKLVNCTYVPGTSSADKAVDLIIPSSVAGVTLKSIDSNCFNTDVKNNVTKVIIKDGSQIYKIEGDSRNPNDPTFPRDHSEIVSAFKDFDNITEVVLGDSVREIGVGAFYGCDKLEKVTIGENIGYDDIEGVDGKIDAFAFENCKLLTEIHFATPAEFKTNPKSAAQFTFEPQEIGLDALATGSSKLTIYGEIGENYAPFEWSMQSDNYVDANEGIRVCYKTNSPSNLTVILDNTNGLATLVDYPHLDQLDDYAIAAGLDKDADGNAIAGYSLVDKIKNNQTLTKNEQDLYNAVKSIDIPEGIESIDVKGYIINPAPEGGYSNNKNVEVYLDPSTASSGLDYFNIYKAYGLFNGLYGKTDKTYEYAVPDAYYLKKLDKIVTEGTDQSLKFEGDEESPYGNDIVEKIIMHDVKYLPDLAFYNCENLRNLSLGDDIENLGSLPFADCKKLGSVTCGNTDFETINGIVYENTDTGKKIIQCLPGRGDTNVVGDKSINKNTDPELTNVEEISEGAFSNCDVINFVNLDGIKEDTIPKYCFYSCDNLSKVTIPDVVGEIDDDAFGKDPGIWLAIGNPELLLSADAFGNDLEEKDVPTLSVGEDTLVAKMSKKLGKNKVAAIIDNDPTFFVFYYCGRDMAQLGTPDKKKPGESPNGRSEATLKKHETSEEYASYHTGYKFATWVNRKTGATYSEDEIEELVLTKDMMSNGDIIEFEARYDSIDNSLTPVVSPDVSPGTTPGSGTPGATTPGAGTPGVTSSVTPTGSATKHNLKVIYGRGSGQYSEGTEVLIEAIDAPDGKEFDKWVINGSGITIESATSKATIIKMGSSDATITATYKNKTAASSNNGGGSRNSSGTTNRNGTNSGTSSRNGNNGTTIDITKPGVSNTDKAYASVSGSTDSFIVRVTESADAANRVATALAAKYPDMSPIKYFAMDISLYDSTGTNKITDTTGLSVNITMPIPDALAQYAGNNMVGAVNDSNTLEDLACKFTSIDGIPCVSFTATHFSPYTIYVDTANLTSGTIDYTPKTGDAIHPKWFVALALAATSLFLFFKRDKKIAIPKTV